MSKKNIKNFEKFQVRNMNVPPELLAGFVVVPEIVIDDTERLKQMPAATIEFDELSSFIRLEDIFRAAVKAVVCLFRYQLKIFETGGCFAFNILSSIYYQLNLHKFREIIKPRLFAQTANSNLLIYKKQFRFNLCH